MFIKAIKMFVVLSITALICDTNFLYSQENYEVTGVSFEGNKSIESGTLEDAVTLSSTGWFSKNILRNEPFLFNSEILNTDISNIIRFYQREGFLSVKVDAEKISDDRNKEIDIVFKIVEGSPVIVDKVQINRVDPENNTEVNIDSIISEANRNFILTKGKRFRDEDIREDEIKLTKLFLDNGYPHINIDFELSVDTVNYLVSINWHIRQGILSKFGKTNISGLDYYRGSFIKDKLDYSEGEIFNADKLDKTRERLSNLGIFYGVNFKSILNKDPQNIIPVELNLLEAKRFKTTLGIGYGEDEKFRGSLELTLLGFLRSPGRINFEAKRSAIEKFSFKLSYTHPEFLWERTSFRLNTFVNKINELPYNENSAGLNIGILGNLSKNIYPSINYSLENINLDVGSIAIQDDSSLIKDKYNKSGFTLLLKYTNAEPYISPGKGFNITLSCTYSGIGMNSPYKFFKSIIDFRNYSSILTSIIAGIKLSIGYLKSFNHPEFIPVEERFYLGGSSSVRGWKRFELGPADMNDKPKGGKSFMEGSIELRYPALEKIYGVIFLDFGNVWEPPLTYRINELQYALGAGVRYATPIGPLRLDLARPVFNSKKTIQFWFSIGHAF